MTCGPRPVPALWACRRSPRRRSMGRPRGAAGLPCPQDVRPPGPRGGSGLTRRGGSSGLGPPDWLDACLSSTACGRPVVSLDYEDRTDFEDADRGFVDTLDPLTITDAGGRTVFDMTGFSFLQKDRPESVHPSLFRQSQLCWKNGLYEVTDGIYQIRGFDLSNMTLVEGESGVIVIDPLIS